jgi:homoserine kinase
MQQVTVRVPASTSNLGPGFDCLGLALRIYNSVTLVRGAKLRFEREPAYDIRKQAGRPFGFRSGQALRSPSKEVLRNTD